MNKVLNEKTLIPIGAAGLIFGASMWLTSIYAQGINNAAQIQEIKQKSYSDYEKIEQKLDKINEKIDKILDMKR